MLGDENQPYDLRTPGLDRGLPASEDASALPSSLPKRLYAESEMSEMTISSRKHEQLPSGAESCSTRLPRGGQPSASARHWVPGMSFGYPIHGFLIETWPDAEGRATFSRLRQDMEICYSLSFLLGFLLILIFSLFVLL